MLEWYRVGAPLDAADGRLRRASRARRPRRGAKSFAFRGRAGEPVRAAGAPHGARGVPAPCRDRPLRQPAPGSRTRRGGFSPDRPGKRACASLRTTPGRTFSAGCSTSASSRTSASGGRPSCTRYPASEAALARLSSDDPRIAERFELYCCGVELANAFHELHRRGRAAAAVRRRHERAVAHLRDVLPDRRGFPRRARPMPDACGAALGFDRLAMLATGADRVEDVQWTPIFDPGADA